MLPLDAVDACRSSPATFAARLLALRSAGCVGVSVDVWWGLCEPQPRRYEWEGYKRLLRLIRRCGLSVSAILSFHACGGNVGDDVNIPLPAWVSTGVHDDCWYTDAQGSVTREYISLWWDEVPIGGDPFGRTPLAAYREFAAAFCEAMAPPSCCDGNANDNHLLPHEIAVSLGPCGELRYPSYRLDRWRYPGAGAFQCFDGRALACLKEAAARDGMTELAPFLLQLCHGASSGGSAYNVHPHAPGHFFSSSSSSDSFADVPFGRWFQRWYSDQLLAHAERVLQGVTSVVHQSTVLSSPRWVIKLPGIHWQVGHPSRAAEATAGLYPCHCSLQTDDDGSCSASTADCVYARILRLCDRLGCELDFTCLEMRDETPLEKSISVFFSRLLSFLPQFLRPSVPSLPAYSRPFWLVRHVALLAHQASVPLAGENALLTFAQRDFDTIIQQCLQLPAVGSSLSSAVRPPMSAFTFLRMCDTLFEGAKLEGIISAAVEDGAVGQHHLPVPPLRSLISRWDRLVLTALPSIRRWFPFGLVRRLAACLLSPWGRFALLVRCLANGRPYWYSS